MKTQSKPINKNIKNKIPFCPRKIKPTKKIIKINPENQLNKNNKHAFTPKILLSKKFEVKRNNKKETKKDIKRNPFHAITPKRKSFSEKKIKI